MLILAQRSRNGTSRNPRKLEFDSRIVAWFGGRIKKKMKTLKIRKFFGLVLIPFYIFSSTKRRVDREVDPSTSNRS